MNITYCKGWFRAQKRPIEIWDKKKAKKAHNAGKLYTVLVGETANPYCFIDLRLEVGFVGVSFLDSQTREYLTYEFTKKKDGYLFLSMSNFREYDGDTDSVIKGTTYYFNENGSVKIEKENFLNNVIESGENIIDVKENWENIPDFGDYSRIYRIERKFGN